MDLEKFATSLGIPGLLIGAWYLLELAKGKRMSADAEREGKIEEKRLDLEARKIELESKRTEAITATITTGFAALAMKIDEHTKVDLAHHATVRAELAAFSGRTEGMALERERTGLTPVHGVPSRPSRAAGEYSSRGSGEER